MLDKDLQKFKNQFQNNLLKIDEDGLNTLHHVLLGDYSDEFSAMFVKYFAESQPEEFSKRINAEVSTPNDYRTFTPMAFAAYTGKVNALIALAEKGAQFKTIHSDDTKLSGNILHLMLRGKVAESKIIKIIDYLITSNAEHFKKLCDEGIPHSSTYDTRNKFQGFPCLSLAVFFNYPLVIEKLCETGISLTETVEEVESKYAEMNILHLVIVSPHYSDSQKVCFLENLEDQNSELLKEMLDSPAPGYSNETPLLLAGERGLVDTVMALVNRGASLSAVVDLNLFFHSMNLFHLIMASDKCYPVDAENIIAKLAKIKPKETQQLLGSKVREHTHAHGYDWKGYTPTLIAAAKGKVRSLAACLDNGATLKENNLLLTAARYGQLMSIKFIIKHASEDELTTQYGNLYEFFAITDKAFSNLVSDEKDKDVKDVLLETLPRCKTALLKGALPLDISNNKNLRLLQKQRNEIIKKTVGKKTLLLNMLAAELIVLPQEFLSHFSSYLFADIRAKYKIEIVVDNIWPFKQLKQIAILSLRAWRHRQPLMPQDHLIQNPIQCRDIIQHIFMTLFSVIEKYQGNLSFVKIVKSILQKPYRQMLITKLSKTDLSKDQIHKVLMILIKGILDQSIIDLENKDPAKDITNTTIDQKEFALDLGKKVFATFFAAKPTFPFVNYNKSKSDLENRIYEALIENYHSLSFLKNNANASKKLIMQLSECNFSSQAINELITTNVRSFKRCAEKKLMTERSYKR